MSGSSYFPLFKLPFVVVTPFSQTPKRKYPWPFQESNLEVPTCIYLFICLFMYLYPYIIVYFLFSAKCQRYHRFLQFYSEQYVLGNYRKAIFSGWNGCDPRQRRWLTGDLPLRQRGPAEFADHGWNLGKSWCLWIISSVYPCFFYMVPMFES